MKISDFKPFTIEDSVLYFNDPNITMEDHISRIAYWNALDIELTKEAQQFIDFFIKRRLEQLLDETDNLSN